VFEPVDYAKLAESMGCLGLRVEHPDELGDALRQAFAAGRPAVIDAISDITVLGPPAWD
jgi:thiamine pyrophosphate-dependent acetolactate synthase large subunit-like protein